MCTFAINNQFNGIEISFVEKPAEAIRDAMKEAGFRWHRQKKLWYAKKTAERMALAQKLSSGSEEAPPQASAPAAAAEPVSKYGIKVGDILYDVWGYSMTLVEYYKVTKIVSPTKIEIAEVGHIVVSSDRGGGEYVLPDPEREIGERIVKQVVKNRYDDSWYVKINDSVKLKPHGGSPKYKNTYD